MVPSEEDWQEQKDEIIALASILDQSFSLTGPSTSGNIEDDVATLIAAEPSSQQIQCTAALHVVLPSGRIHIKVTAVYFRCYQLRAAANICSVLLPAIACCVGNMVSKAAVAAG